MRIASTCALTVAPLASPHTTVTPELSTTDTCASVTDTDVTDDRTHEGSTRSTAAAWLTDGSPRSPAIGVADSNLGSRHGRDATHRTTTPDGSTRSKPPPGAATATAAVRSVTSITTRSGQDFTTCTLCTCRMPSTRA